MFPCRRILFYAVSENQSLPIECQLLHYQERRTVLMSRETERILNSLHADQTCGQCRSCYKKISGELSLADVIFSLFTGVALWLVDPGRRPVSRLMKNQIMERQASRGVLSHLCGHVTAAKACAFIVFILSAHCRLSLVLLSSFLQRSPKFFHPYESSFLNLLFVAAACYLLRFSSL